MSDFWIFVGGLAVIGFILAIPKLVMSLLGSLLSSPVETILGILGLAMLVGLGVGIYLDVTASKQKGGWGAAVGQIWSAAQTGRGMSKGSAWLDLTCMFIIPGILILLFVLLVVANIVSKHRAVGGTTMHGDDGTEDQAVLSSLDEETLRRELERRNRSHGGTLIADNYASEGSVKNEDGLGHAETE